MGLLRIPGHLGTLPATALPKTCSPAAEASTRGPKKSEALPAVARTSRSVGSMRSRAILALTSPLRVFAS